MAVSERGGVANLEVLDPVARTARTLTRVTGAALAPEPDPRSGDVFFLSMHAGGMDLNRIRPDSAGAAPVILPAALAPVAPRVAEGPPVAIPRAPVPEPRRYGIGPRTTRVLPMAGYDADGPSVGAMMSSTDPIGRLALMARGVVSADDAAEGGSLAATWRGWRPAVTAELFGMDLPGLPGSARPSYLGAALSARAPWRAGGAGHRLQGGVSGGWLEGSERVLGFAEYGAALSRRKAGRTFTARLRMNAAAGSTAGAGWARGVAGAGLGLAAGPLDLRADGSYGRVSGGAPAFEALAAGGGPNPLVDDASLAQRIPMPAAPFGVVAGRELATWRLSTRAAGVTPYLWGAAGDGSRHRVAGVEGELATPFSNVLGMPGMRFTAGLGVPLDAPRRHEPRAYFSVTYAP